jgi:hypothetical protein
MQTGYFPVGVEALPAWNGSIFGCNRMNGDLLCRMPAEVL